ncbi:MAG TPA: DEAD/DEAH box helicase [Polyangiaceae bacterium]|nr:DEAD/DEAH box helicase [Polyangiaceae bacterium]
MSPASEQPAPNLDASVLLDFHPAVRSWFERRFPHGPTAPQASGWPAIRRGEDTLIAAPTGSGKTLSGFLVCIDRLYRSFESGRLSEDKVRVVYVSPLKALTIDIRQNLAQPLREIAEVAAELGCAAPELRVAVRSGDTKASERASMLRTPPHFLITTPESLYLMLTAERSRALLDQVETVIVDEIHALARDKRGSHLSLSLERLQQLCGRRPLRIGLSATQRPIERVARLLVGANGDSELERPCTIVDSGHRRALDLKLELPERELEAVASAEHVAEVLQSIAAAVKSRRTTLIFSNTRRLAERLAHQLGAILGEDQVLAHHGSLSKERRQHVEERLRSGSLRALVATASLELGIDVGPVELVCQIGSPRSIATFLQRVGRSGHSRWATPVGRLYPLTRDELVECAALLRAVSQGRLDAIVMPAAPLDILAQHVVAECAAQDWDEDALFALVRRAAPYSNLPRVDFDAVLELVSEGISTGRGLRAAYLHRDRVGSRLSGRRGARLSALTSGGAIPDNADYRVVAEPDDTFVGTINEDFAIESMAGDVFLLGSTAWRIRRVTRGVVRVVDAAGAAPTIPFWLGEAPARTLELSEEVSALRVAVDAWLEQGGTHRAREALEAELELGLNAARDLAEYLNASRVSLGVLPSATDVVFERFFDDTGGMQLIVHAPFGGRVNRALGLLMRKRFCRSFDFELQAAANDDAIVLSLGPQHSFPLDELRDFLRPAGVRDALVHAVLPTPMFAVRWRWNLNRALVVLRFRGGKKNPAELQRMEADDVTAAVFPALAACQDNATGPREIPDHVLVRQTLHDCLHEAMDVDGLERLLRNIADGSVRLHFRETTEPSPLAHEILNSRPYTFLDDAPLEERRTRAVQLRRGLPVEARALGALDPEAIARVRAEAAPDPRNADELCDLLSSFVVTRPLPEFLERFEELVSSGRAARVALPEGHAWCALELRARVESLFPDAAFEPDRALPEALAGRALPEPEAIFAQVLRGHLDTLGPMTRAELARTTLLSPAQLEVGLARLEGEGFVVRGHFEPGVEEEQVVARRLLARIHSYTVGRLRREIEPVSAQDFMRFLLSFQRVTEATRRDGRAGLLAVIEQLQGFEAAVGAWEPQVLAARINGYRPEWLDALCYSGEVVWGRLSPRARVTDSLRTASLSRATPVTLALRADLGWLLQAARGTAATEILDLAGESSVLQALRERGASFASELCAATGLSASEVDEALWDGVARGLLTSDGFQSVRTLMSPRGRWSAAGPRTSTRLRRGARGALSAEGRWAFFPQPAPAGDADALAEAVAEQLLARWGVVLRELVQREVLSIPYRDVLWALRRLEARGTIRGGRFVAGFSGEQYALPEAVELLRKVRREARSGELVRLSACDPLNLVGTLLPGARVPALAAHSLAYRDGLPELAPSSDGPRV